MGESKVMNKKEAREILVTLVFESEFNRDKSASDIYEYALEERGFEPFRYIKKGLSDIVEKRDVLADIIEGRADGWKVSRMAPMTRSVLLVAAYDMVYKSCPCGVAINEALELAKKYDDDAAPAFINGVLNKIAEELDAIKADIAEKSKSAEDFEPEAATETDASEHDDED